VARGHKKKKKRKIKVSDAELNIMPFIDIFSMLNTFLLVSAVFVNIGIHEVQIPFLTNAPPPDDKPKRSLDVKVSVEETKVLVEWEWTAPPQNPDKLEVGVTDADLARVHQKLIELRQQDLPSDKVTVFSDDTVKYSMIVKVIDAIKIFKQDDPKFQVPDEKSGTMVPPEFLYPKVVMGSVIL
jgi:biopolymer transport protein ExbD